MRKVPRNTSIHWGAGNYTQSACMLLSCHCRQLRLQKWLHAKHRHAFVSTSMTSKQDRMSRTDLRMSQLGPPQAYVPFSGSVFWQTHFSAPSGR